MSVLVVAFVKQRYLADISDVSEEDAGGDNDAEIMVHVGNGFYLANQLYASLFDYQREGVLFLWGLFEKKKGGILGDDMG